MSFDKFTAINNELSFRLQKSDLNYARLILPTRESEAAVIGKYAPHFLGSSFITLNEQLDVIENNDFSKFYYGVSPKLDSSLIIAAIANLQFIDAKGLKEFVKKYSSLFMLHKGQEKYVLALAKYIVLAFSYNYGIRIFFPSEAEAKTIVDKSNIDKKFLTCKEKTVTIHGCPTSELIQLLEEYRYISKDDGIYAVPLTEGMGVSITDIYKARENISLVNGDVFYSGVLPRTLQIEEGDGWHSNKDVTPLYLYYERSTYATVFALDNNFTRHPIIANERELIIEFFRYDDDCKRKYLNECVVSGVEGRKKLIREINRYLECSYNVNQIGVTANVISSNGFLIYGKRGANAIDSGKIYPSVNGNAEIADADVEFYRDSVNVDYPTLNIDSAQNGFGMELCREGEAELNFEFNNNLLKCYGMVISGCIPAETEALEKYPDHRRLHFNILFKQKVNADFREIKRLQSIATEKYENSELHGVSVKTYKGFFDFLKKTIEQGIRKLLKCRLVITNIFTIALFLLSFNTISFSLKDWSSSVSFGFALLIVIMTVVDIIKGIKEKRNASKFEHSVGVIMNKNADAQIDEAMDKILKNNKYHPVVYIALKLYLLEAVFENKQ